VPGGGEPTHVHPDLCDDHCRCGGPDPGDLIETVHRVSESVQVGLDPFTEESDVGLDPVDPRQHLG
jgi:hypothetical protein